MFRRRATGSGNPGRVSKGRKKPQPFRIFISRLTLPRLRFARIWPTRGQGKEAQPEGLNWERFFALLLGIAGWFWKWGGLIWRWSKPALPVLILVHLGLVALFPGGANRLFGVKIGAGPKYLTPFQMVDALGYEQGRDGFLVYKIFSQNGELVQGVYPDDTVLPRLRQDRWAAAGHAISGPYPVLHRLVLERLLERLPAPPVRLEMFSARYHWDRDSLTFPWPGRGPDTTLKMTRLGVYTGFSRQWNTEPVPDEAFVP
ncbi:MAG: hypothetical protein V3S64_01970 [bacterium]